MIGLLGTSNSLVCGIDEYANTHHFMPTLTRKNAKNGQMQYTYPWFCVFMCFWYEGLKVKRQHTILIDKRAILNDSTTSCAYSDIKDEVE